MGNAPSGKTDVGKSTVRMRCRCSHITLGWYWWHPDRTTFCGLVSGKGDLGLAS